MLTLPEYIAQHGDEAVAKLLSKYRPRNNPVKTRTVMSWRLRTRFPTKEVADLIVQKTPVTYDGIYSVERKRDAA